MKEIFLYTGAFFTFISCFFYIVSIFKKRTKPHRTTRFVLMTISLLAFISLYAAHNTVAIWLAGVEASQAVFMFAFAIRYGMGGRSKTDILCLLIALFGIYMWQTTKNPIYGLYFSMAADFTGFIPTFIKTYKLPHTEVAIYYVFGFLGGLLNLFALSSWTINDYSYPVYIIFGNLIMLFLILRPKLSKAL